MARPGIRWIRIARRIMALGVIGFVGYYFLSPTLRSTEHFLPFEGEPRVLFERGAEKAAAVVARSLPDAIRAVESGHFTPFPKPVTVHVCATEESFERYAFGVKGAGGYVFNARLFISPKPANTAERLPRIVAHELSHLHLAQRTGAWYSTRSLPSWLKEGLAVNVAKGGGAETVSEAEARAAIVAGRVFEPTVNAGWAFWRPRPRDGLPQHLFYRESALFVDYLARRSPKAYEQMLRQVQERRTFSVAVEENFGRSIAALWAEFVADVRGTGQGG